MTKKSLILFLSVFYIGPTVAQLPGYLPANGLVAWYPFNGNANDESGNGNNGTVFGSTLATDRNGNINSAYFFNGTSNYIEMAATPSLQPGYLSISIWYNSANTNIGQHLLGKSNYSTGGNEMYAIRPDVGSIKRNSSCIAGAGWNAVIIQNSININTWYHLVMTWDGQLLKAFVNGVLVGQNNSVPPGAIDACSGGTLRFGTWWAGDPRWFSGKMDDIGIWNRALTAQEVQQLYQSNPTPVPSYVPINGLVAWYPFNENANDESGNGNNGTVYGPTLIADRFGNLNSAYHFNSTNYIRGSSTNYPSAARTVSLWYNGVNIGRGFPTAKGVFGYGGLTCGESWFQALDSILFHLGMHCGNNNSNYHNGSQINNSWHHWLITNDGTSETKFYIDGLLVLDTTNFYNNTFVSGRVFIIGGIPSPTGFVYYTDGNIGAFEGEVDDVGIWNRALTSQEVHQLYQYNIATICPGNNISLTIPSFGTGYNYQWQVDTGTGFVDITDNSFYSGTNTNIITITAPPSSWYGYKYRCNAVNGSNTIYGNAWTLKFKTTWSGTISSAWEVASNWSCNSVPDQYTDVIINTGVSTSPVLNSNRQCRSLSLSNGSVFTVTGGFILDVKGK